MLSGDGGRSFSRGRKIFLPAIVVLAFLEFVDPPPAVIDGG